MSIENLNVFPHSIKYIKSEEKNHKVEIKSRNIKCEKSILLEILH